MKITQQDLLRYEELKSYEKQIKEELDILNENILTNMLEQGVDESPALAAGKIILVKRDSYIYSDYLDSLEDAVTEQKAIEKANGTAKVEQKPYIKYQKI